MTISEKTLDVEGVLVHYFEGGADNGRALLLLHGGVGDARANWYPVLPALAESFHVFAPDLPGFDGSGRLAVMSIDGLIHWLHALLDALGQADVVIVGSFLGGLLARLFAAAEPQYIPGIILVNGGTMPSLPPFAVPLARWPLIGGLVVRSFGRLAPGKRTLDQMVYARQALTEEFLASWRKSIPGFNRLARALVFAYDLDRRAPPVPTLLLWGVKDALMPLAEGERLQQEIPGALLSPIDDCGHLPQLEASDVFVFQVTSFLNRITRPPVPVLPGVGLLHSN